MFNNWAYSIRLGCEIISKEMLIAFFRNEKEEEYKNE